MSSVTFPIAPLERIARNRWETENTRPWSIRVFATMLNKPPRTVGRWIKAGFIPWTAADASAVALGLHPMMVWPEQWLSLDEGLVNGTDERAERAVSEALNKIGEVLESQRDHAVT